MKNVFYLLFTFVLVQFSVADFHIASNFECPFDTLDNVGPFCNPTNSAKITVGDDFYITWVTNDYIKADIKLLLIPIDQKDEKSQSPVWSSEVISGKSAFKNLKAQKKWLRGESEKKELFVQLQVVKNNGDEKAKNAIGPSFWIYSKNYRNKLDGKGQNDETLKSKIATVVGVFVGMALIVFAVWCFSRKMRSKITIPKFKSRRGYGERQSRRQRDTSAYWSLDTPSQTYRDNPEQHELSRPMF